MEKIMKFISGSLAVILLFALIPFIAAYLIGLFLPTSDYWLVIKICRVLILLLIIGVPMMVPGWRENQRFFIKWVGVLLLYVIVTTFLWAKGF